VQSRPPSPLKKTAFVLGLVVFALVVIAMAAGDDILGAFRDRYVRSTDLSGRVTMMSVVPTQHGPRLLLEQELSLVLNAGKSHVHGYSWGKLESYDLTRHERAAVAYVEDMATCLGVAGGRVWCVDPADGVHGREPLSLTVATPEAELFKARDGVRAHLLRKEPGFNEATGEITVRSDDARWYAVGPGTGSVEERRERGPTPRPLKDALSATVRRDEGLYVLSSGDGGGRATLTLDGKPVSSESFIGAELLVETGTPSRDVMVLDDPPGFVIAHYERLDGTGRPAGLELSRLGLDGALAWTAKVPGVVGRNHDRVTRITVLGASATPEGLLLVLDVADPTYRLQTDLLLLDPKTGAVLWHHGLTPECASDYTFLCDWFGTSLH
jgi:hypothetical protein